MHNSHTRLNHISHYHIRYWRPILAITTAIMSLCLLTACVSTSDTSSTSASSNFHTSTKTSDSQLTITLDISPNHVGPNTFTVHITDANGTAQTQDTVSLAESMTTMNMGTEVMPMQPDGKGGYTASGSIGMSGTSQVRVVIHTPDHVLHTATVTFDTTS